MHNSIVPVPIAVLSRDPDYEEIIQEMASRRKPRRYFAPESLRPSPYSIEFCMWLQQNFDQLLLELK